MANERTGKQQLIALLLAAVMLLELLPFAALKAKAADGSVLFLDENGDQVSIAQWMDVNGGGQNYTVINPWEQYENNNYTWPDGSFDWGTADQITWYIIDYNLMDVPSITVTGDVRVVLLDGKIGSNGDSTISLGPSSITVKNGGSLTIYGESDEEMRAEKSANNSTRFSTTTYTAGRICIDMWDSWNYNTSDYDSYSNATGEVGLTIEDGGAVAVYGGILKVQGGQDANAIEVEEGGQLTISGGEVKVNPVENQNSTSGDGIKGAVEISGGTVTVNAQSGDAFTGPTTITGGTVTAIGVYGDGFAGTTTISGGTVAAFGVKSISDDATTRISGGTVELSNLPSTVDVNGNALITLQAKMDEDVDTSNWNGLVSTQDDDLATVTVYGNVTLTKDTTITWGRTLDIPETSTLTLEDDVTLTLDAINNDGLILLGDNAKLMTSLGAEVASNEDEEDTFKLGTVKYIADLNAEGDAQEAQSSPAKKENNAGGALLALLLGGGIAVGTAVYFYVKSLRAPAEEDAAAEKETTEEVTGETTDEAAPNTAA